MTDYELVCGVEAHVRIKTRTKLFCGCPCIWDAPPNSLTCPACLGLPGALPVLNGHAVELAIAAALALNCQVSSTICFDRKHYYYPDLPKNYQITQLETPLASNGVLGEVRIQRAHLEEDAGKLFHDVSTTRIDFNRSGAPLLEVVTYPDMHTPESVKNYMTSLRDVMVRSGASDCRMERGELRFDVNISVRPVGSIGLGVKTELKNLNSFRFAVRAIDIEFRRHLSMIERGERIVPSTWLYDQKRNETRMMRSKEEASDYRYMPEPDLPPLKIDT